MPESTHQASGDHPVSSADTRVILRNRAMRTENLLRMKALWLQLTTLVERLGQGPVPLSMSYPVEEAIVLKVIRLENFAANCDDVDRPSEVLLRYQARGHAPLKILPPTSDAYFELRHRLFDHRLGVHQWDSGHRQQDYASTGSAGRDFVLPRPRGWLDTAFPA